MLSSTVFPPPPVNRTFYPWRACAAIAIARTHTRRLLTIFRISPQTRTRVERTTYTTAYQIKVQIQCVNSFSTWKTIHSRDTCELILKKRREKSKHFLCIVELLSFRIFCTKMELIAVKHSIDGNCLTSSKNWADNWHRIQLNFVAAKVSLLIESTEN